MTNTLIIIVIPRYILMQNGASRILGLKDCCRMVLEKERIVSQTNFLSEHNRKAVSTIAKGHPHIL